MEGGVLDVDTTLTTSHYLSLEWQLLGARYTSPRIICGWREESGVLNAKGTSPITRIILGFGGEDILEAKGTSLSA